MTRSATIPGPSLPETAPRHKKTSGPDALSRRAKWPADQVKDEWVIVALAVLISMCGYGWYASRGLTFGYADALSRMEIARRVLVSRTPGLAQLGTTWPPLQPMLMMLLIWNNTLFHDGFAGSFPSMAAYVIASLYMYRLMRLLFSARAAAWVAALVFMLNPNVVYMQSTAMSEVPMICTAVVAVYYMLIWARSYYAFDLVKCAAAVAAGTAIRYDGWPLAVVFAALVVYLGWRRRGHQGAQAWGILYGLLAFSGIAAWVIYNQLIFHDALLFIYFGNSSNTLNLAGVPSYHHAGLSFEMYGYAAGAMVGWVTTALAAVGLTVFVAFYRLQGRMLPVYGLLIPFAFYWLTFFLGWDTILLPQLGANQYWNARFGLQLVPAMAFFTGYLATWPGTIWRRIIVSFSLGVTVFFAVANSTVQTPFARQEPLQDARGVSSKVVADWLIENYHGGNILINYLTDAPEMFYMMQYIPDDNFITDANGWQYTHALEYPQLSVTWIVMDENNSSNQIWVTLHNREVLQKYFVLRAVVGTTLYYQRN
jgi:4-amino-4-deoxy-L-arabinose transferase-like glycosyltransferase